MAEDFRARGDPARSLALLWGERNAGRRGPPPGLSIEQIAQAAAGLADAEGLGALSMRRVADALGVGTMSPYRYVPGKAELLDVMVEAVLGEQQWAADGDWRARLAGYARAHRELHERHPWLLQASIARPPMGPNAVAGFESLLAAVSGIGLSPSETVAAVQLVSGYVRGAVGHAAQAAGAERRSGIDDREWWSARSSFWDEHYEPERFPALTALYEAGAFDDPQDAFEFGLQRILDGIERLVESR